MNYPYPDLVPLLKFLCGPTEYWRLLQAGVEQLERYITLLPYYTYARCPICRSVREERIDTYSLSEWQHIFLDDEPAEHIGTGTIHEHRLPDLQLLPPDPCEHFLGIKVFLNLHGAKPVEMRRQFGNDRMAQQVPCVMPWWLEGGLEHGVETYAVLHALPVCRTVSRQFVPSYTLFTLTYFCADYSTLVREIMRAWGDAARNDPELYASPWIEPRGAKQRYRMDKEYDLAYWAESGLLGWLDLSNPEVLPLRIGAGSSLPSIYGGLSHNPHE